MSRLRVFNEDDGGQVLLETREHTAIATELAEIGVILHEHGGERTRGLLAEWLGKWTAHFPDRLTNPFAAASILTDMMFGAVVRRQFDPRYWPGGDDRRAYLRECIRCFVNGAARI